MVLAVAKAVEGGAKAIVCASTGNTSASAAAYGAAAGLDVIVILPGGQIALGKLLQALVAGARVVAIDGNFDQALHIVRGPGRAGRAPRDPGQLGQSVPARRPADRGVRDLRRPRAGAGRARDPGRQRGQHQRLLGGVRRVRRGRARDRDAADARLPGQRRGADRPRPAGRPPGDRRDRDPHRRSRVVGEGRRRARRLRRPDRRRHRRRDPAPPTATWPGSRASSASPRPPRRSPGCGRPPPPAGSTPTSSSSRC